jgi:hypothetical protein
MKFTLSLSLLSLLSIALEKGIALSSQLSRELKQKYLNEINIQIKIKIYRNSSFKLKLQLIMQITYTKTKTS